MLPAITLFSSTFLVLLTFITLLIVFLVIIPKLRLQTYQKPGVKIHFFPVLGLLQFWAKVFKKTGDMEADSKRDTNTSSEYRLLVSNLNHHLFFVLRDPKYTKEMLQNPHLYRKSPILDWAKICTPKGMVVSEGEVWKRHRKIISNSFHYEFLKNNVKVIQDTAKEFLDKIPAEGCKDYNVIRQIQEITGEIVGRIFFGENLKNYTFHGQSLTNALAESTAELAICGRDLLVLLFGVRVLNWPFIPKYRRLMGLIKDFRKVCTQIVEDRKTQPQKSNDLLAALLATQKLEDVEQRFTDDEIIDEFITFFVAGMDTTGHLVAMTLYILTKYPEYLTPIKEEREKIYNKSEYTTSEDVQKMEVLHSLLKETLRFYTPGPLVFARVANVDHNILDLKIKKGDLVVPDFLAPAFDSQHFKNPEKFDPDRWRTAEISKLDPYAFLPFSAGPRNCIGQHLAMIEAKIVVSEFLNRFNFKLEAGYDLKMTFKFVYEAESDFKFDLFPIRG